MKHRFLDETDTLPDMAFLVEFAPGSGLKNNESEVKGSILLTKNFTNEFLAHVEVGYIYETEKDEAEVVNSDIIVYNLAPIYRVIPDKLLLIAELNGKTNNQTNVDDVTIAPEVIYVAGNTALKIAVPFGITDDAKDTGVKVGVSRLF